MKKNIIVAALFAISVLQVSAQNDSIRRERPRRQFGQFEMPREFQNPDVHDPVIAFCDGRYYIFATGFGVQCMSSADLVTWKNEQSVLNPAPEWAINSVNGYRGHTWAPDIQFHNGLWYLFYSCSSFGKNTSAIGLAVNKTLNPDSPDFKWIDKGLVVRSIKTDNFNAIDPNMIVDQKGKMWLTWGSFWDGIQLAEIDTKKIDANDPNGMLKSKPTTVARRFYRKNWDKLTQEDKARSLEAPDAGANAIEAPFLIYNDGYYYLFVSWDYCCKGERSNYKTVVGRSKKVTGPFLDSKGNDMAEGGGDILWQADDNYYGVGHCGLAKIDGQWYFVAHGYSKADRGRSKLVLRKVTFNNEAWPELMK